MPAIEVKGKSVDEAIFKGLNELGLSIDEVEIEILKDGKGFLGIGKSVEVKLTPKSELPESERAEVVEEQPKEEKRERPERRERRERRDYKEKKEKAPEAPITYDFIEPCEAEKFLNDLLEKMNIDAKCGTVESGEIDKVVITGKDTAVLIGRRGETLDALQYLASLVVNKDKQDYVKVMVDTENYRQKREETLVKLANRIAAKVVKTGRKTTLEPMNPYERRILHYTLQGNPKVETYSEGEDPYRRVVIKCKKKQQN